MSTNIDPITLEVVRGSLVSTVMQMRTTLLRTSYAPILYETLDFSCGIMTADGELGAMSEDFSGHVFAMALGLNATLDKFGDDIHPADTLIVNDPYTGGTHMNDIAFYTPFFAGDRPLLYIAVRAHWADVGGATPGSFSGQDTEIYQEGVRIVPVKLIEGGVVNQGLWDVMFANMRLPDEREGDALAMLDAARVAERSLRDLCDKYGPSTVQECVTILMDKAEQTMRRRIAQLPDGEFFYEQYMDNSGLSPEPLALKVKLTIEGDLMTFDFTGTAPQVVGPMNVGIPVTHGGIFVIVKSWLDPKTPVNGGTFRALKFVVPEGSLLAAELPAAVGGCWDVYRSLQTAVIGLFSQVMPGELGGENLGSSHHRYIAGYDPTRNRPYILYAYPAGGTPGTSDTDGSTGHITYDAGDMPMAQPAEGIEQRQPLIVEAMEATGGGESPGYRRSGWGITLKVRVLVEGSQLSVMHDRSVIPPWGAAGAYSGSLNSTTVLRDGVEIEPSALPGKVKGFPLKAGDVVVMGNTAGGGVGDPLDREVELLRTEVRDGYVTPQRARDVYGVVMANGEVDLQETRALRDELRRQRRYFNVTEGDDEFDGNGCRVGRLNPAIAGQLGVEDGDMLEYVSRATAPLRAWVKVDGEAPVDGVTLGRIGRSILNVGPGQELQVRRLDIKAPHLDDVGA